MKSTSAVFARAGIVSAVAGIAVALAAGSANATIYDNWGAMAISKATGNTSYAIDYGSQSAAEAAAVEACGAYDCQAVVYFANGCGAVAQALDLSWSWSYGASRAEAEANTLAGATGHGAQILGWACTTGHL